MNRAVQSLFGLIVLSFAALPLRGEIPPQLQTAVEQQLQNFGNAVSERVLSRKIRDLNDFSLKLIRPGIAIRNQQPVAAYWLFYRLEIRHDSGFGGAKAEGTVVLELVPVAFAQGVRIEAKSWVLDMRYADWGGGALLGGEEAIEAAVTQELPPHMVEMANQSADALSRLLPKNIPSGAISILNSNWLAPEVVAKGLFPVRQTGAIISDTVESAPELHGDALNAALIVIFSSHNDANRVVWRRPEDINGLREEKQSRYSWIFRMYYLPGGSAEQNLTKVHDGRGDWNDRIGSVIVLPGPKWSGEVLTLFSDIDFNGRRCRLGPGIYSLRIKANGACRDLWNCASSFQVSK